MSDDLRLLLENIRQEAARLQADGIDADSAYQAAIVTVFRQAAEGQALDAFDLGIVAEMRRAEREYGGKPVPTTALAVRCGVSNRVTMWKYLHRLEDAGLIYRPFGKKSKAGWRARVDAM